MVHPRPQDKDLHRFIELKEAVQADMDLVIRAVNGQGNTNRSITHNGTFAALSDTISSVMMCAININLRDLTRLMLLLASLPGS